MAGERMMADFCPSCGATRMAELEKKNTFWACTRHTNNNTLRCAICDEERIAELRQENERLRAKLDKL
jgi:hypothetical protein